MSADFSTSIKLKGTKEEYIAMLNVLKAYEQDKYSQYVQQHNCEYIMGVILSNHDGNFFDKNSKSLSDLSEEELLDFLDTCTNGVFVSASGPWGVFGFLDEITLFDDLAIVAPKAIFKGSISGFSAGGDQDAEFELIDGLLHSRYAFQGDEGYDDYDSEDDEESEIEWDFEVIFNPITKEHKEI